MTCTTEISLSPLSERARKPRPARELVADLYELPARVVVRALLPLRVPPPAVVLAHGTIGIAAAIAVERRAFLLAAILLQAATLLDSVDGQLARVSGRVTALGRYLDTEVDFVVNVALFAALASATGAPWLALAAFLAVTATLSIDYNLTGHYRQANGDSSETPSSAESRLESALALVYCAVFAPQDRLLGTLSKRRLERVLRGEHDPRRMDLVVHAYEDRPALVVLANLGLATQFAVLGVFLVLGSPTVYLWLVVASLGLLPLVQLRREQRARAALARQR